MNGLMKTHALADAMVAAARLSLDFGRVDRITFHPDGKTKESDTDHTVMLGLIACSLASSHFPALDVGRVAQFALVHDLVEVYAGDTATLRVLTCEQQASKKDREHAAFLRIKDEFRDTMPWLPFTISEYEILDTPEAQFVKALDKLLPKLTHILNGAATLAAEGVGPNELAARYGHQIVEMMKYAAGFPLLFDLRDVLVDRVLDIVRAQAGLMGVPR